MELKKKKNAEIYYYQIETWHQLDQDLDLSQQLKTNDLIFRHHVVLPPETSTRATAITMIATREALL